MNYLPNAVCHPFVRSRYNLKAWMFIVPVFVIVNIYVLPRFFEFYTAVDVRFYHSLSLELHLDPNFKLNISHL